jgi:copper chaperone CopZ
MNAKTISTLLLVIAAVTVLVLLAFRVRIGATADAVAVLRTAGMTCGSCSNRITTALEALHGVAVTEVDVEGGWVVVGYDTKSVKSDKRENEIILKLKQWWKIFGEAPKADNEVLLGSDAAKIINVGTDDSIRIKGESFKVAGILDQTGSQDDSLVFASLRKAHPENGAYSDRTIQLKDGSVEYSSAAG